MIVDTSPSGLRRQLQRSIEREIFAARTRKRRQSSWPRVTREYDDGRIEFEYRGSHYLFTPPPLVYS